MKSPFYNLENLFEKVTFKTEAEMLVWVVRWLKDTGWEVYQEVSTYNGYCDIVAVRTINGREYRWAIEGKTACNSDVIMQAWKNQRHFDFVSVCTPFEPNFIYEHFMREKRIGCIVVKKPERSKYTKDLHCARYMFKPNWYAGTEKHTENFEINKIDFIDVVMEAPLIIPDKRDGVELHKLYKNETAGTTGQERTTPYKISVHKIKEYCEGKEWVDISTMIEEIGNDLHWRNVRQGVLNVVGKWEVKDFDSKQEKRKYYIRLSNDKNI